MVGSAGEKEDNLSPTMNVNSRQYSQDGRQCCCPQSCYKWAGHSSCGQEEILTKCLKTNFHVTSLISLKFFTFPLPTPFKRCQCLVALQSIAKLLLLVFLFMSDFVVFIIFYFAVSLKPLLQFPPAHFAIATVSVFAGTLGSGTKSSSNLSCSMLFGFSRFPTFRVAA